MSIKISLLKDVKHPNVNTISEYEAKIKEAGKYCMEGKEYVVQDGNILILALRDMAFVIVYIFFKMVYF